MKIFLIDKKIHHSFNLLFITYIFVISENMNNSMYLGGIVSNYISATINKIEYGQSGYVGNSKIKNNLLEKDQYLTDD